MYKENRTALINWSVPAYERFLVAQHLILSLILSISIWHSALLHCFGNNCIPRWSRQNMGSIIWVGGLRRVLILTYSVLEIYFSRSWALQIFSAFWGEGWLKEFILPWCLVWDRPLKTQFPSLFRMAHLMNAMVREVVSWNGDICHWNLTFVRSRNDWEEDSICSLLALFAGMQVLSQGNDEIVSA